MKNAINLTIVAVLGVIAFASCKRSDDSPVGGKGGAAVIYATPQHHSKNIDSCKIYIKYNSSEASTTYDDSAVCVPVGGKPVATFSGLKNGKYYLFGKGYDPSILQNVKGGTPYEITTQTQINLFVPVTEDH